MLSDLLGLKKNELENFIIKQQAIFDKGIVVKIITKRSFKNFPITKIINETFKKICVLEKEESPALETLCKNLYRFSHKESSYHRKNPYIIKDSEVSVHLLDDLKNPTFNEIVKKDLVSNLYIDYPIFQQNIKEFLADPEKVEKINEKKSFYLIFQGLKSIDCPVDATASIAYIHEEYMSNAKKDFSNTFKYIESIKDNSKENYKIYKLGLEIKGLFDSMINESEGLFSYYFSIDHYRRLAYKYSKSFGKPFLIKKIREKIEKSRIESKKVEDIYPKEDIITLKYITSSSGFYLAYESKFQKDS